MVLYPINPPNRRAISEKDKSAPVPGTALTCSQLVWMCPEAACLIHLCAGLHSAFFAVKMHSGLIPISWANTFTLCYYA